MFRTLFNALKTRSSRKPARRTSRPQRGCRPRLEALEDRCVPSFVGAGNYDVGGTHPTSIGVGDVNADGNPDLVVDSYMIFQHNEPEEGGWYETIWFHDVLLGNGSGGFNRSWDYPNSGPGGGEAPDFNRDGIADGFTVNLGPWVWNPWTQAGTYADSSFSVQLGDGAGGTVAPQTVWWGSTLGAATAGDFNRDGYTDLAVTGAGGHGYFSILLNDAVWPPLPPPISAIRINDMGLTEGNMGTRMATFTVSLSIPSDQPVTVAYATANGIATAGSDYQAASGTLTFASGETSKTITVLVNADRLGEPNESFVVNLSNPTNSYVADGQAVGTITDDEPRISTNDVTKAEGKKGRTTLFVFTVTLSAAYDQPVTMSFATSDGTAWAGSGDYVAKSGTLTFAPGETTKTITITVKGDSKKESDDYFFVDLSGNSGNSVFDRSWGVGTILNDD